MKQFGILFLLVLCTAIATAQTKQEIKEAKRQQKLKYRHSDWPLCFIVKTGGDTIVVNVKPDYLNDYCTTFGGISFTEDGFKVAYGNGEEQMIHPEEFKEMYLYDKHARYFVITGDDNVKYITKVLEDGKCKLLYRDVYVSSVRPTNNFGGGGPSSEVINANLGFYYALYNDKLTRILSGNQPAMIAKTMAKNCREIFSECPTVVGQINEKTLKREDLAGLVKAFNACLQWK